MRDGRCERHAAQAARLYRQAHPRPSASAQGYGRAWQKLRAQFLAQYPVCMAPGCSAPATEVDHLLPKARGGTDDWQNLQALCKPHHSQKTARQTQWGRKA